MTSARWTRRTGLVDAATICRSTACCRSVITILAADPGIADLHVGECGEPGYLGQNGRNHARPVSTFGTSRREHRTFVALEELPQPVAGRWRARQHWLVIQVALHVRPEA